MPGIASAPPPLAPDLSRRAQPHELPELMDQPATLAEMRACLRDVAWLNRILLGYRPILHWLESLTLIDRRAGLRILDVGSGYGDTLRRIAQWAQRKGVRVQLTGLDLNPHSAAIAAEATPAGSVIQWLTGDVFAYQPPEPPHLIVSSLMTHHLTDAEIVHLLQWLERHASAGWFINDLSRNIVPYRLLYAFTRLMRLHSFVQHDGPVSIARAFRPGDWQRFCGAAGLAANQYTIKGFTPGRLCVSRIKAN